MTKYYIYKIQDYKHSSLLGEAVLSVIQSGFPQRGLKIDGRKDMANCYLEQ